jgi:hypothetical protein
MAWFVGTRVGGEETEVAEHGGDDHGVDGDSGAHSISPSSLPIDRVAVKLQCCEDESWEEMRDEISEMTGTLFCPLW